MKVFTLLIPAVLALAACAGLMLREEESNAERTAPPEAYITQTETLPPETHPQPTTPPETAPPVALPEETEKPHTIALAESHDRISIPETSAPLPTEPPTENKTDALPVSIYCQYPDYPTGCECAALYMLLDFYGTDATMAQLVEALPKGSLPYETDGVLYGANPENAFVGNPESSDSFGVFNAPIAQTANQFREGAVSRTGASLEEALEIIDSGNPVIAWYTTDPKNGIVYRRSWLDPETGETIVWPGNEHAVVITWHDETSLCYNDSNTGTSVTAKLEDFREIFDELGGRIVYYEN